MCIRDRLYVATSKPEIYARQILEHFQMDGAFSFIGGADMEETRVKKADVIRYVLHEAGIPDEEKGRTVMVGDREHDIEGAKENGISSVGVLVGYGSAQELEEALSLIHISPRKSNGRGKAWRRNAVPV